MTMSFPEKKLLKSGSLPRTHFAQKKTNKFLRFKIDNICVTICTDFYVFPNRKMNFSPGNVSKS